MLRHPIFNIMIFNMQLRGLIVTSDTELKLGVDENYTEHKTDFKIR